MIQDSAVENKGLRLPGRGLTCLEYTDQTGSELLLMNRLQLFNGSKRRFQYTDRGFSSIISHIMLS
jgi:hypothetical protein